jgi:hypothetical protein
MSLPVIHGTSAANFPLVMTFSFLTGIGAWQNGAQQRWVRRHGALVKIELPYAQLTQTQKNTVKTAFTAALGRNDQTLSASLPYGGSLATFFNFGIDSDQWAATESKTTQYSGPLKLTQQFTQSLGPGTAGTAFPALANGSIGILPYTQKKRFQTVLQGVEAGPNYKQAEFGTGPIFTGYPGDGLMSWEFGAAMLSDADTVTLVAHFIANWGRAFSFTFTDEDSVAYTKTHYAMDDMTIRYNGPNDSSIHIALEATF